MKFTKMHGISNDYIYINGATEKIYNPSDVAIKLSDRHTGIGSDGIVMILPSKTCDFRMRMFNSDGSEAEMCGNASRCVGKYVYDKGLTKKTKVSLETLAGKKILNLHVVDGKVDTVTVDMGEPILRGVDIPTIFDLPTVVSQPIVVSGKKILTTCVSMGNPHSVVYVDDVDSLDLEKIGPSYECHPAFPHKTNTEFVEIISRNEVKMRVWERGAGETMACGTGACAVAVASVLNGFTDRDVRVKLRGGDLQIKWDDDDNHVYMTGPATTVYEGDVEI
ncbi:MAG: diaminopimelate epimerase [Paludibacteraceae bacterium]|jgi:diaminopimelate epimerase|nr:diaminopimelate epimerase [Paludibacteraceae bacterium]